MACCGQVTVVSSKHALPGNAGTRERAARATVNFQYTGRTGLTAVGPVSGMQYRFGGPGATLPVDTRDSLSLASIPNLRRIP